MLLALSNHFLWKVIFEAADIVIRGYFVLWVVEFLVDMQRGMIWIMGDACFF